MKMFKTAAILLMPFIFMIIHFYFLYKIVEKHQVHYFYFIIYFVIYFLSSLLLVAFNTSYIMKPAWILFVGGICGWLLSFFSLLVTDIILGEALTIRWRVLFMASGSVLIGWYYFPLLIFIMKHFKFIKRKL
jgi:hypothetical protein